MNEFSAVVKSPISTGEIDIPETSKSFAEGVEDSRIKETNSLNSLTIEELQKIISQDENEKLEFKSRWNQSMQELIKYILALANGSPKHIDETAYFIIGVDERDRNHFSLKREDVLDVFSELKKLLKEYSKPEISDVLIEWYDLVEDNGVLVISIPPQGCLVVLAEDLINRKGLIEKKETIFYRDRDSTKIATGSIIEEFIQVYGIIILYKEDDLDINLIKLVEYLNDISEYLNFKVGEKYFELDDNLVTWSESYNNLNISIQIETKYSLGSFFFTKKPYNNNYFFQGNTHYPNLMIVSFSGWNSLSTLPYSNAIAYFTAEILSLNLSSYQHQENTGCLYDFSSNKADIDKKIKKAYICESCYNHIEKNKSDNNIKTLADIKRILKVVGEASKNNLDVINREDFKLPNLFKNQIKTFNEIKKWLDSSINIKKGRSLDFNDLKARRSNTLAQLNAFSGIGKSELSYVIEDYAQKNGYKVARVVLPLDSDSLLDDMILSLDEVFPEHFKSFNKIEFIKLLSQKVLIIIDDFQHALKKDNAIKKEMNIFTSLYRNRKEGKVLFISSKTINFGARDGEISNFKINRMDKNEAKKYFSELLTNSETMNEIPQNEIENIITVLNHNPRAFRIFISQLKYDYYQDILIKIPTSPLDIYDIDINNNFLFELEKKILSDSFKRLQEDNQEILRKLSIYRNNISSEIFRQSMRFLGVPQDKMIEKKEFLWDNFLLERDINWFVLNPLVKVVIINKLTEEDKLKYHKLASSFFTRYFDAKDIKYKGLGAYFIEARYHLLRSNQISKLSQVSNRYAESLLSEIYVSEKPPIDKKLLEERIMLLKALFEHGGSDKLRWHYSRCLEQRNRETDLEDALSNLEGIYLQQIDMTMFFIDLTRRVKGIDKAIEIGKEVVDYFVNEKGLSALYLKIINFIDLSLKYNNEEAIELLKEGIKKIPVNNNVVELYLALAELLEKENLREESIKLLKDGINKIPINKDVNKLYFLLEKLLKK